MKNIYKLYIPSLVFGSPRTYSIKRLCELAIGFAADGKTVCLASLGIATVDKEVMDSVIVQLHEKGYLVTKKILAPICIDRADYTLHQTPDLWSGSLEYYELIPPT